MGLLSYLRGDHIEIPSIEPAENRTLTTANVPGVMLPYGRHHGHRDVLNATPGNVLRIADAYSCVRVLSDAVASLPPRIYRRTPTGRIPVGDDQRLAALLRMPSPGSTSADLFGCIMADLQTHGNAYVGKYRGADGEIVQLGCLDPSQMRLEVRGQTIAYLYSRLDRVQELTLRDLVHIRGMTSSHHYGGLIGLSPVAQCRLALSLSASLQDAAVQFVANGARPSGVLSVEGASQEGLQRFREAWRNEQSLAAGKLGSVAVVDGDTSFTALGLSAEDSQFLQQRQLSATEVARVFRVPPWMIGAPSGDTLTYSNALEQTARSSPTACGHG
jgi:HK97 family phage portal protein